MHDLTREALREGARLLDEGAFFDAHEAWEERWRVETDEASRRLLQELMQYAAGFHKLLVMRDSASRRGCSTGGSRSSRGASR